MPNVAKTLFPGVPKSRAGAPSMKLQTLIDRTKMSAFWDELRKQAEDGEVPKLPVPTKREATEAHKVLTQTPLQRLRGHLESGSVSSVAAPLVQTAGRAMKAFVDAEKGNGGAAALKAVKNVTKGDLASQATTGLLTGMALSAGRTAWQRQKAQSTYDRYEAAHPRKEAS